MMMPRIVLNMIVKDEGEIIAETLKHVRPLIDAYAIVDTGSSDNTIAEIKKSLADIPGRLETMEWKGFSSSRNAAIDLANGLGDYLLFLDADDKVVIESDTKEIKKQLQASLHPVLIKHGPITYDRHVFRSLTSSAKYHFQIHEVLIPTDQDQIGTQIAGLHLVHNAIGISARNKQEVHKCLLDAQVIEKELANNPQQSMVPRYQFYLGQSYRDCGELQKAFEAYKERFDNQSGWNQERYIAAIECGKLVGKTTAAIAEQLLWFHKAIEIDPRRSEAYFEIALLARQEKMWRLAFENALKAKQNKFPARSLFARWEIYEWQAAFEVSIAAYYVGEIEIGTLACEELLHNPAVPNHFKELTLENQKFYVSRAT